MTQIYDSNGVLAVIMVNIATIRKSPHLAPLLLLVTAAFCLYGRLLRHEFMFNWDDEYYLIRNAAVQGFSWEHVRTVFSSCYVGNYAPVQMLSYMLDYSLWGLWPGGYYLGNLLLHLANAALIYVVLIRFYRDRLLSLCAAAIFLLHPVQVETVAWISQRKTLLSLFFFLLAWLAYCRYRDAGQGAGRFDYAVSLTALVLALLSKSVAVIFPVVLVLYDLCFLPVGRRLAVKDKVPFIVVSGVIAIVSIYSQQPVEDGWMGQGGGAVSILGSGWATFCTMATVFCRYVGMLVWPANLSLLYFPTIHRSFDGVVAAAALLLLFFVALGVWLFRKDRRAGFWFLFFWVGILPVSQIVPLITLMNDRYLYFPMVGAAALYGVAAAFLRDTFTGRGCRYCSLVVSVPIVLLVPVSLQRVAVWQNPVAAWSDTVAKNPYIELPLHKLGEAYQYAQPPRLHDALTTYLRVTEMNPAFYQSWYQIGSIYSSLGDYSQSIDALQKFLAIKPEHIMGRAALGQSYQLKGDYSAAEKEYKQALSSQPDAMQLQGMLGSLALAQGDLPKAREYYLRVEESMHDPDTAFQLACIASRAGQNDEALVWLEKALQRGYADWRRLHAAKELSAVRGGERFTLLVQHYFDQHKATGR